MKVLLTGAGGNIGLFRLEAFSNWSPTRDSRSMP
jgi:hypothetical protein